MNEQENDKQTTLEDLGVDEARQDEVKGGPTASSGPAYTGQSIVVRRG